jgi:hypothetical protein
MERPTVLARMLRYPVEVLYSERPGLVEWIHIRNPDGSEEMVQFDDLVCIEGPEIFWRYIRFVNRIKQARGV